MASDSVRAFAKISGTVVRAKGLLNTKLLGKSAPRCYVKGIKGNSHLVDFFCTPVSEGNNPQWDAPWSYDCMKNRSRDEFVGIKFVVYDGEEFLGGADFDLSEISAYVTTSEEMELLGVVLKQITGHAPPKKARLFIECSVERKFVPPFERPHKCLMDSMRSRSHVLSICGRIVRARGVAGKDGKRDKDRSWPMCFVRAYMNSGQMIDLFHTKCDSSVVDPNWNTTFEYDFSDENDQPLMLIFDLFGSGGKQRDDIDSIRNGKNPDHLGTAMIPVNSLTDEDAFARGNGRMHLALLGECQIYEKRLERDAGRAAKEAQQALDNKDKPLAKKSWMDKYSVPSMSSLWNTPVLVDESNTHHLTVELFADRENVPMPRHELLHDSIVVEEGDIFGPEGEQRDENPDEELKSYFGQVDADGERVKRLEITAEERITSIYGRVKTGCDLIASDIGGRSDPYVIVEALSKFGTFEFVYRTRYIRSNLNPSWGEGFFWEVPRDPENEKIPMPLSKLQFSIYDSDDGQVFEAAGGGNGSEDDFLGQCSVDITTMRNNDYLSEEVPLLGVKTRPGGYKSQGGFRRYSTIGVEVRVERRVVRIVSPQHDYDRSLLDCHRHNESRAMLPPAVKGYRDLSQLVALKDPGWLDTPAGTVVTLRDTRQLLELARYHSKQRDVQTGNTGWMAVRPATTPWNSMPMTPLNTGLHKSHKESWEEDSDDGGKVVEARVVRRDWKALTQSWKDKMRDSQESLRELDYVNRMPPMHRTASLPSLAMGAGTRFGENYERLIMDPFEENAKKSSKFIPPVFENLNTSMSGSVLKGMRQKPGMANSSMRRNIRTAPAALIK